MFAVKKQKSQEAAGGTLKRARSFEYDVGDIELACAGKLSKELTVKIFKRDIQNKGCCITQEAVGLLPEGHKLGANKLCIS